MQIRDATIDDIPRLADLWRAPIGTHADYGKLFPWRIEAPEDIRLLIYGEIRDLFLQGEERCLVVEAEAETDPRRVVAWAWWTRKGSSDAAAKIRAHNDTVLKGLQRQIRGLEEAFLFSFNTVFQISPKHHAAAPFARYYGVHYSRLLKRVWVGEIEEHW